MELDMVLVTRLWLGTKLGCGVRKQPLGVK